MQIYSCTAELDLADHFKGPANETHTISTQIRMLSES